MIYGFHCVSFPNLVPAFPSVQGSMYSTEPPMAVQARPVTVPEGKLPSYSRSDVKTCQGMMFADFWCLEVDVFALQLIGILSIIEGHPLVFHRRATGFPTYSVKAASSTRNSIGEGSAVSFSDASPSVVVPPLLFVVLWGHREVQKGNLQMLTLQHKSQEEIILCAAILQHLNIAKTTNREQFACQKYLLRTMLHKPY